MQKLPQFAILSISTADIFIQKIVFTKKAFQNRVCVLIRLVLEGTASCEDPQK